MQIRNSIFLVTGGAWLVWQGLGHARAPDIASSATPLSELPDDVAFGHYLGCGRYHHFLSAYAECFDRSQLRVYLYDGDDAATITGTGDGMIVRVIGGEGDDRLVDVRQLAHLVRVVDQARARQRDAIDCAERVERPRAQPAATGRPPTARARRTR